MNQDHKYFCKSCFKIFPCGQSLGGHLRSHYLSSSTSSVKEKENLKSINGFQITEVSGHELRENPKNTKPFTVFTICCICGREFESLKALYGHLKQHSDKVKRVIRCDDKEEVGHEGSLMNSGCHIAMNIPVKKKRSKRYLVSSPSFSLSSGSEHCKELEVAKSLIMLSESATCFKTNEVDHMYDSKRLKYDSDSDTDDYFNVGLFSDDSSMKSKKVNLAAIHDDYVKKTKSIKLDASDNDKLSLESMCSSSTFECSICNKRFASHQALGGHISNHRRMKHVVQIDRKEVLCKSRKHECRVCGRTFSSGNALGGHMSKPHCMKATHVALVQNEKKDESMEPIFQEINDENVNPIVQEKQVLSNLNLATTSEDESMEPIFQETNDENVNPIVQEKRVLSNLNLATTSEDESMELISKETNNGNADSITQEKSVLIDLNVAATFEDGGSL